MHPRSADRVKGAAGRGPVTSPPDEDAMSISSAVARASERSVAPGQEILDDHASRKSAWPDALRRGCRYASLVALFLVSLALGARAGLHVTMTRLGPPPLQSVAYLLPSAANTNPPVAKGK